MISFVQKHVASMAPHANAFLFFSHSATHTPTIHTLLHTMDFVMFQLNQKAHVVFQYAPEQSKISSANSRAPVSNEPPPVNTIAIRHKLL